MITPEVLLKAGYRESPAKPASMYNEADRFFQKRIISPDDPSVTLYFINVYWYNERPNDEQNVMFELTLFTSVDARFMRLQLHYENRPIHEVEHWLSETFKLLNCIPDRYNQ
jgi:hypothetical protein